MPLLASPFASAAAGGVNLSFALRDGRTVIDNLHQAAPCRAFFPDTEADDPTLAVLVNTAGGLVGGDRLASSIGLAAGTSVTITTQTAEKIYRSLGPDCRVNNTVTAEAGTGVEWLPQETILFDGSRLDRRLTFHLASDARMLAAEMVLFGRSARGEHLTHGHLRDSWSIRIDEQMVWADALVLSGDIEQARRRPFGFGDAAGYATLVLAGPGVSSLKQRAAETAAASGAQDAGCSLVNGVLILRCMDKDAARLRAAVAASIIRLRQDFLGLPPRLPRAWMI